jgi:hypothetical protein
MELIQITKHLSKSESGILYFKDLVDQFVFYLVRQMIRQNLRYYRETKSISGDSVLNVPSRKPVVTTSCVPTMRGMQKFCLLLIRARILRRHPHSPPSNYTDLSVHC